VQDKRQPNHPDLRSTFIALEAEYRVYRRAAEQYHAKAELGFQLALEILGPSMEPVPAETVGAEVTGTGDRQLSVLTNRERQTLTLIASGHSTKQTASVLGITFKTAAGHRSQLMKKLRIHDTASLVRFAIRAGLVEP
jgi:DNA-binding CsgD family transcriptional regulator